MPDKFLHKIYINIITDKHQYTKLQVNFIEKRKLNKLNNK